MANGSHEAKVMISALRDHAVLKRDDAIVHKKLDRLAHDIEEQVG